MASTEEARVAWLNMAQLWLQLAQHAEQREDAVACIPEQHGGAENPPAE